MAGPIRISIISNGRQARADLTQTGAAATRMGASFQHAAKLVVGSSILYASARGLSAWVRTGNAYTSQLAKIEALATKAQLAQVGGLDGVASALEKNRHAYARYGYDVADASDAVTELVKAGKTLPQSLRAVNATMVLARAGNLEVSDSAELVSNTLNAFHLRARQAGQVVNELANAANLSSADVGDLAESLKYVSVVARSSGLTVAQTSTYLAILSNNGVKASMAGTGLRKVLQSLEAPTGGAAELLAKLGVSAYDSDGKAKPLNRTLAELNEALGKVGEADRKYDLRKIFGLTGLESANILLGNLGKNYRQTASGIDRAGAATKLARANSAGLVGTLKTLRTELVDDAQIIYREWSPALNDAIKPLLPVVRNLGTDVANLKDFLDGVPGPLKSIAIEGAAAALIFPRLSRGALGATGAIRDQITYLRVLKAEYTDTAVSASGLTYRQRALSTVTNTLLPGIKSLAGVGGMVALAQSTRETNTELAALERIGGAAAAGFSVGGPWGAAIGTVAGSLWTIRTAFHSTTEAISDQQKQLDHVESIRRQKDYIDQLRNSLNQLTGAYTRETRAQVYEDLQSAGLLSSGRKLGVSSRTLIDAVIGDDTAVKRVKSRIRDVISTYNKALKPVVGLNGEVSFEAANQHLRDQYAAATMLRSFAVGGIGSEAAAVRDSVKAWRAQEVAIGEVHRALGITKKDYAAWPADLREALDKNFPATLKELKDFASRFHLTTSQLRTIARAGGINIGTALTSGLARGILANESEATSAGNALVSHVEAEMRRRGEIQSPSRMTRRLGRYLTQGVALGITDETSAAKSAVDSAIAAIVSRAKSRLQGAHRDLRSYESSIRSGYLSYADVTAVGGEGTYSSATAIKALQLRAQQSGQLNKVLAALAKAGLNNRSLRQLVNEAQSGDIGGALSAASAIRAGGKGDIRDINKAVSQIAKAGDALATTAGTHFYGGKLTKAEDALLQVANQIKQSGYKFELHLTAEQITQLQRGKQIRADLDAWDSRGGKKKAKAK